MAVSLVLVSPVVMAASVSVVGPISTSAHWYTREVSGFIDMSAW